MGTYTLSYRGPAMAAGALAQMLRDESLEVSYTPPPESRGAMDVVQIVALYILCEGTYDALRAGVAKFRSSRFGTRSKVDMPDETQE